MNSFAPATRATRLLDMLGTCRPHKSRAERRFIRDWIAPLGMSTDTAGNLFKRIGDAPILWSCHTDTVHRIGGAQSIVMRNGTARLDAGSPSNCLGADDTAGIWLMSEMIRAERPGLYVFHRAEEVGGKGSNHIAFRTPELLDGIAAAIAFDRRGTTSVITHQYGGRCCSDAFAESLGLALGGLAPDDGGSFTDTANYIDLIGECTNVSVGYANEHTSAESLDVRYLDNLLEHLLEFDASTLVLARKPGDPDPDWTSRYAAFAESRWDDDHSWTSRRRDSDLASIVRAYPEEVADFLEEYGIDAGELLAAVSYRR